ncbi:MAG TPA: tetratricopeptide repeat protein [Candidatus Acidoferrum sp.]|nr:tetratricopeptide repeat protein [Candidatus Acidoferrum sp.]
MKLKLAITVLLLAFVAGGSYWYSQRGTKLSETDTVLIGDFANATGDPVFDGTLREALAVSLAQSPSLNLVSVEKVGEALKSLGQPAGARVTRDIAPKLCPLLGATVYLNGGIAKDGSGYSVRLDASRCTTGDDVASVKGDAADKREALHALGTAAAGLRAKFGEETMSLQKFDLPLERATTASLEALAAFTEGRRLVREKGAMDAVPALKKAVELDPKFALAHSNLAVAYYNLNQNALAADQIRQAFELADRQTVRDRLHITTLYYDLATGDVQKAIRSYKEWVQLYPRDDIAKGNLASEYFLIGDYDQAATFAQQALRLDPGSAAWYENLATAYIALQRLEEAKNVLDQAFARKLDDPSMHADLYALAFLRGEPAGMEREMAWSVGKPGGEDDMLALQADTEAYAGHVQKARELSRRAVEVAQNSQLNEPAAIWQGIAALREAVYGNFEEARKGADKVLEISPNSRDAQTLAILILARIGDVRRAQTMMDDLVAANVSNTVVQSAWVPTIRAQTAMINQKPTQALEFLDAVKPYERGQLIGNLSYSCMIPVYLRAEAYLAANRGPQALAEFQKLIDNRGVVGNCWSGALAHLGQGRAQVMSGSASAARTSYQEFFALWKDADANIPILKAARTEFAKLK